MSTDLEQRLHDELRVRAGDAGPARTAGGTVRQVALARRTRRLRAGAVVGSALLAAGVVVGVVTCARDRRPEELPPAQPTCSPTSSPTTATDELVRVSVPPDVLEEAYALMGAGRPELVAAAALPGSGDPVLVFTGVMQPDQQTVVHTVTVHDGQPQAGTVTFYRSWDHLIAQPARDGTGATLVVVAPATSDADTVEVTTSLPGKDIRVRRVALDGRLALVPLPSPQSATRLRLLRGDAPLEERIPGDYYLAGSLPRPLARVVVATTGAVQAVQVRTDGVTACRMTVAGFESPDVLVLPWNPIDDACARIEPAALQLLIAEDRRYSSVAGVAPQGTDVVRLRWRDGDVTDVPVAVDEVPAFDDTSGHRPDRLVLAEALDRSGTVIAQARP
jgi:hypothetical protein